MAHASELTISEEKKLERRTPRQEITSRFGTPAESTQTLTSAPRTPKEAIGQRFGTAPVREQRDVGAPKTFDEIRDPRNLFN